MRDGSTVWRSWTADSVQKCARRQLVDKWPRSAVARRRNIARLQHSGRWRNGMAGESEKCAGGDHLVPELEKLRLGGAKSTGTGFSTWESAGFLLVKDGEGAFCLVGRPRVSGLAYHGRRLLGV
jgi:hypothetical protein